MANLSSLIILILIILQFGKGCHSDGKTIDNGILFIIALFYLACCMPKTKGCC